MTEELGDMMYERAINILKEIESRGFKAYIVGGYPRDRYLHIPSEDIDICTSAYPDDLVSMFENVDCSGRQYGCVRIHSESFSFTVTTFRKEYDYEDGRHVCKFTYVNTLEEDLKRRDFIINTLCIDRNGNYIDIYGAKEDIENKVIRSVGDSFYKFNQDHLRILRAIRFSVILDFSLDKEVMDAIITCGPKIQFLSSFRKKQELDKIFRSSNCMKGVILLSSFHLSSFLYLYLSHVSYCSNYLGIWAQCLMELDRYPFTRKEKRVIIILQKLLHDTPRCDHIQQFGIELCSLVDEIRSNSLYYDLYKTL